MSPRRKSHLSSGRSKRKLKRMLETAPAREIRLKKSREGQAARRARELPWEREKRLALDRTRMATKRAYLKSKQLYAERRKLFNLILGKDGKSYPLFNPFEQQQSPLPSWGGNQVLYEEGAYHAAMQQVETRLSPPLPEDDQQEDPEYCSFVQELVIVKQESVMNNYEDIAEECPETPVENCCNEIFIKEEPLCAEV